MMRNAGRFIRAKTVHLVAGLALVFAAIAAPPPALAQYYDNYGAGYGEEFEPWEYEYEPGEGLHEEEWYDPSDWFDLSPTVNYEDDSWGTDRDYDNRPYHGTGYSEAADYGYGSNYGDDRVLNRDYDWSTEDSWYNGWYEGNNGWF